MRKLIVTLMASLLSCSAAFAFWPEATDSSLEIGVGYRQDRFEWKTSNHFDSSSYGEYACEGLPERLRSHLKWRNLRIWQIEAQGKYVTCDNLYFRANADYGWITHGKNSDSDSVTFNNDSYNSYGSDFEFARSHSKVKGNVYDARIAVGYQFKLCDDSFALAPVFGWSWHGKHLNDRHLKENTYFSDSTFVLEGEPAAVARARSASFSEYSSSGYSHSSGHNKEHSRYHARWNGPFIGFDFDYRFGCFCEADWELFGTYEFHWATYHAKGHWKLRHDLLDKFHHRAKNAYGHIFDIGIKWDFCECWTVALKGEFQWWWAHHGRDRAKIAENYCGNVHTDCFLSQRIRDIKTQSAAVSIDVGMVF